MGTENKLSVIVVNDYAFPQGGASVVALQQAHMLSEAGHNVAFFTGQLKETLFNAPVWSHEGQEYKIYSTEQHDLLGDPLRIRAMFRGLWNFSAARYFGRLLDGYSPENTVILFHGWSKVLSGSVAALAARRGFAIVGVLHDYAIGCPNGTYYDFGSKAHCIKRPLSGACIRARCDKNSYLQKIWRVMRQFLQSKIVKMPKIFAAIVFVSKYQQNIIRAWLSQEHREYVLPNFVPTARSRLEDPSKNTQFLFVGRLSAEKGGQLFAESAALAKVQAVIAGDGEDSEQVMAANPGIRILGWIGEEEMAAVMLQARALVFPSLYHETFGLCVYEAASLGLPLIVADKTAASEFVIDGENGLVFQSGNARDLADCMTRLKDNELARHLGAGARDAFEKFNQLESEKYAMRLEGVLRDALAGHLDRLGSIGQNA